ncbi:MAG: ester cyclase [Ferruginibacter sp.]
MENSIVAQQFIEEIWNNKRFEKLDGFLHPDFKDYSLPPILPPTREGTRKWIVNTGISFEHQTIIEDQVSQGEKSILKIRMNLKHIGQWRSIEPTGIELNTIGYRYFIFKDKKIIAHYALIDGQAIESQIKNFLHACKIAE